jgi:RNA polymerase primary sigma factor/RNA polymerase sigma factor
MIHYGVSAKTLYRWRKKGLVGYTMVFPDGKRRLGFKHSAVKEFEEKHGKQIRASGRFKLMTDAEQDQAVELARQEVTGGNRVFSAVVRAVADKLGRSRETIRHLLQRHESENPDHRIFAGLKSRLSERDKEHMFRLYLIGIPIRALCQEYGRNRSTIYRIIYQIKASEILADEISYMYNPLFDREEAADRITEVEPERVPRPKRGTGSDRPNIDELPAYLRDLHKKAKLMTREEEQAYFRRFNYLKHLMAVRREQLKVTGPKAEVINEIEDLYHRAVNIKQRIIRANLRRVVSIAKRHTRSAMDFNTLVSDGNLSLMQAVEKFDYARGNRFSTYASWAIMKNYAKSIPEESSIQEMFRASAPEVMELMPGATVEDEPSREQMMAGFRKILNRVLRMLSEREREVIVARFGLRSDGSRATLEEIGSSFDLSKERIRQIEAKALRKLRHELDLDQVDALLE